METLTKSDFGAPLVAPAPPVAAPASPVRPRVFAIFATLRTIDMKHVGVGLAAAVLIDA